MIVNWQFNANQYEPNQGFGIHPPALKAQATISNTTIKENKEKTGGYLEIEYTTAQGTTRSIYNINHPNPKVIEIAYGQLSAVCRAAGIYQIDGNNECAALRGGKLLIDIGYQKGEEPDPAFPDRKGYTELKRVYDINGNDPSKPNAAPQVSQGFAGQQPGNPNQPQNQPQGGPTPLTQQGGSWGQQPQQPAQQQPQAQQNPNPNGAGQAWQPGGGQAAANPPWGPRT